MAKVQIKSKKLTPFGGIFSIMELQLHNLRFGSGDVRLSLVETIKAASRHGVSTKPDIFSISDVARSI